MITRRNIFNNLKSHFSKGRSRSQGMVEFAIALPILLMLLFAIIDFSLLFSAWLLVQNMARQAVRYAVTGQFDPANCPVGGCNNQTDEDEARLLTIYDEALRYIPGLFISGISGRDLISQGDIGFLKITVCTGAPYTLILPRMGSTQYGDCLPDEFPGDPGHPVIVMVDFNHPYLTPFLNEIWPMVHLATYHEGIVEEFRVSRLSNIPTEWWYLHPTETPPPATSTFTPSDTPTITPTYEALYVEIVWPNMDGQLIVDLADTNFEAIAYDPEIGTTNGDGIDHLNITFSGPGNIPGVNEYIAAYCAFGGNGPCSPMDSGVFDALPNSNIMNNANDYFMTVTAFSPDGRSTTVVRRFKIMKPNTPTPTFTDTPTSTKTYTVTRTPTNTKTPTLTPTMACSQFIFSTGFAQATANSRPRMTISIRNNTSSYTAVIQSWTFTWAAYDAANPSQSYRRWYVGTTLIDSTTDADSPTTWSGSNSALSLTPGQTKQLRFDFSNIDAAWPGIVPASSFALSVHLDNGCDVSVSALPTSTWTQTSTFTTTYTPSNTFTITNTPTRTYTSTITNTPTRTYTSTITNTPTRTYTFTNTPTITYTPTRTYTPTITYTPTRTYTSTITNTPTRTYTYTNTSTITFTPTRTFTSTITNTPTRTDTFTITNTPTRTFTYTNTVPTPTFTRTFTFTNTVPTRTFTYTNTVPTRTFTFTNTVPSNTPTQTPTRTYTPTNTGVTPSPTYTPTDSRTPTPTRTQIIDG